VLLVEARSRDALRLTEVLEQAAGRECRIDVLRVETLSSAVSALAESSFDVVLLDLSLPDSHGLDTARRLLSLPPCPAVVVLTGPDEESVGLEAVRLGAQDYLVASEAHGPLLLRALSQAVHRRELTAQLEKARAQLESRVEERTRELRQAVEVLQEEVDARLRVERQLRHSNELLERVFDNTHVMLAYIDRQYNFVRVNRCFAQYSKRKESYFPGRNYFEIHPDEDVRAAFDHMIQTGEPLTGFEKLWIDPNDPHRGPTCWNWSMVPVKDADGHVEGLVLSHQDVTESVRDREALHESERKEQEARRHLAAIMESSGDAIFSVTPDGTITSWNGGARRIWGYEHGEIVGRSVQRLMPASRIGDEMVRLHRVFAGSPLDGFDTLGVSRSGRRLHVNVSLSAVRGDDGRVFAVAVSARDITARKRMEREILQVIDEERQRARYELHERLAQRLSGSAMLCRALGKHLSQIAAGGNGYSRCQPLAQSAEQIEDELRAAIGQTTALAHGLMPVAPTPGALMDSLRELARQTEIERAISCEFRCERSVRISDAATANQLYRVAQEAISNAVRCAKASSVVLELGVSDGAIQMTITDNGSQAVGPDKPARGPDASPTGVQVMAYRAGSIGGSLTVRPGPRHGTIVRVSVPVGRPTMTIRQKTGEKRPQRKPLATSH